MMVQELWLHGTNRQARSIIGLNDKLVCPIRSGNRVGAPLSLVGGTMRNRAEESPETLFEIVWFQHNSDDWVAEVVDLQTGERCRVVSTDELAQFIQPRARSGRSQPLEPWSGR